jgi:hypothetical protein
MDRAAGRSGGAEPEENREKELTNPAAGVYSWKKRGELVRQAERKFSNFDP